MNSEREAINALVQRVNRQSTLLGGLSDALWELVRKHPWRYRELAVLLSALPLPGPLLSELDEEPAWNPDYPPEYDEDTVDIWPGRA